MEFNAPFTWQDPLNFETQLTKEEQYIQKDARTFCESSLAQRVLGDFRDETFDREIIHEMGQAGLLGPKVNAVGYGLIAREIERVDSGYRSAFSIQSSLVMHAIETFGSEDQKKAYLPKLSAGQLIGSFCLTEPNHGSNPAGMETQVNKTKTGLMLNGHKRWIGLSPIADVFVVWAKGESGKIEGFIVDRQKGVTTPKLEGKFSLRAAPTGEVVFDNVKLDSNAKLPKAKGLSVALTCLNKARYSIAWGSIGAAEDCWYRAREYVMGRKQFNGPLARHQLIQNKLVDMQTKIALALQSVLRVAHLCDEGKAAHEMVSLVKRNSARMALEVAREARDLLGGNGILDEHHVIRHLLNLETVNTYEGTYNMHTLILGRAQTEIAAFE